MKSCFSVVDASPYHHMCMVPNRNSGMEAGCQAAVAYVQACAAKSIRVRVPPNCVKYSHPHPIRVDTFNFFFNGCVIIRWMDFFFFHPSMPPCLTGRVFIFVLIVIDPVN